MQHVTQWLKVHVKYVIAPVQYKSLLDIRYPSNNVLAMGEPTVPITASRRGSSKSVPASRRGSSKSVDQRVPNALPGLHFDSLCVDVTDKRILWDVTGHALPGRVLAIMGPSGEANDREGSVFCLFVLCLLFALTYRSLRQVKNLDWCKSSLISFFLFFIYIYK